MRKRKYEYTEKQELEILDAANDAITLVLIVAFILGGLIFLYTLMAHPIAVITGIVIVSIATFIFLNYRAWVVVHHRKNVKSQDDNIEEEK